MSGKLHDESSRARAFKYVALVRTYALAAVVVLSALGAACTRHRNPGSDTPSAVQTQTIAPASAQPAPTGTDSMTQTVDVEDGRSEDERGTIQTATTGSGSKKPKPVKKHG
jgi:hypothetical protein